MNGSAETASGGSRPAGARYRERIADAILERREEVAESWLSRLEGVVQEDTVDIFPTATWLDHIPLLIEGIAGVVREGDAALALDDAAIVAKAMELGELRHRQRATVHQLLREYDLLSSVLEDVVRETTLALDGPVAPIDCLDVAATLTRVVRSIMRSTVDTFVERYRATLDEQTDRLRALNGFVAHELRTPLQSASLTMEMVLAMRDEDDAERADLERVQQSIERIATLLDGVETLVQPDALSVDDAICQEVDVAMLVADIGEQLAGAFTERGVALDIDEAIGSVVVETSRLSLVLTNLLGNAVKYSDPDKDARHVYVHGMAEGSDAERVAFVVGDNGLGIAAESQVDVFGLRKRAHGALDEAHGVSGEGLGLYLVAEAVRDMDGTIRLESEVGRGSRFTLILPRAVTRG